MLKIYVQFGYVYCALFVPVSNYLFDELNAGQQIHPEIYKLPFDTLHFVFFLFQNEHVMIKELLQFLVGKIDA